MHYVLFVRDEVMTAVSSNRRWHRWCRHVYVCSANQVIKSVCPLLLNYVNRLTTNYFVPWDTTLFTRPSVTTT